MSEIADPTDIVARTIWGEARGEGRVGMEAVASVIRNRVTHPRWWGHDWMSVCRAPEQFSCWNLTDPNLPKLLQVDENDPQFAEAMDIASTVILGGVADVTEGADSYFAVGSPTPFWAGKARHTVTIGHHAFYRVEL